MKRQWKPWNVPHERKYKSISCIRMASVNGKGDDFLFFCASTVCET